MGIQDKNKKFDREKTSRCWYQLKEVHMRSQRSIEKLAELIAQYSHPVVLMKIAKNGDQAEFEAIQAKIPPAVETMAKEFQELWDSHGHKRSLCLSYPELMQAFKIFEAYQAFDIDLFNVFQPIIAEANVIYNKALKQLLDAQDELSIKMAQEGQVAAVTDVVFKEGEVPAMAKDVEKPVEGLGDIAEGETVLTPTEIINSGKRGEVAGLIRQDEFGNPEQSSVVNEQPAVLPHFQ
jgi:hypothetical protein